MEMTSRNESISELKKSNKILTLSLAGVTLIAVLLAVKTVLQSEILLMQTPGMPANVVIERSNFDKGAQVATLSALTSALVQINPANVEYQKKFVEMYFAPQAYTRLSQEIDARVATLVAQRELGSYYWVGRGGRWDPVTGKHFIWGELHTVNAAKDSSELFCFEYAFHVENYRLWVDDVKSYPGDRPHDGEWLKASGNNK